MTFFDNLSKKVGEAAQATAKKSAELVETTKIKLAISTEEDKIQKAYTQIGKTVYQNRSNPDAVDNTEAFASIEASEDTIKGLREKLLDVKNVKVCSRCGSTINKSIAFCDKCGAKDDTATPTQEEVKALLCDCGAEISPGIAFCSNCGKKVE